jgi:hypothetical protein
MGGQVVCWVKDAGTSQEQDCNGLTGERPQVGRMYHLGFQRELEIERAG